MVHLLAKPLNSGTPEIENEATRQVIAVSGMNLISPPIWFRSCVPVAWSMEPALRNSSALKRPWLSTWKSAPIRPKAASVRILPAGSATGRSAMHAPVPSRM